MPDDVHSKGARDDAAKSDFWSITTSYRSRQAATRQRAILNCGVAHIMGTRPKSIFAQPGSRCCEKGERSRVCEPNSFRNELAPQITMRVSPQEGWNNGAIWSVGTASLSG